MTKPTAIYPLIDSRMGQGTVNNQILQWNSTTKRFGVTLTPSGLTSIGTGSLTASGTVQANKLTLALSVNGIYSFGVDGANNGSLAISNTVNDKNMLLRLYANRGDTGDFVGFQIFGRGTSTSIATHERLDILWNPNTSNYEILTGVSGGGTIRSLSLSAGVTDQILLSNNSGLVTFGGNLIIPNNGFIGSVSDPSAIQIHGDGDVTFTDEVEIDSTLGVSGQTILRSSVELNNLTGPSGLYLTVGKLITTTPLSTGVMGYWTSDGSTLGPTSALDVELGGDLTVANLIEATSSGIKLGQGDGSDKTTLQNVELFGDTDVEEADDGKAFIIHRKAAAGDKMIDFHISKFGSFLLNYTGGQMGFNCAARLRFQFEAAGDIECFDFASDGETREFRVIGFPSGLSSQKGIHKIVDLDGDPYYQISTDGTGLSLVGLTRIGDGVNEVIVSATGDLSFKGGGGLLYGNMDQNGGVFTVFLEYVDQLYELDAATTNISAGPLNDVTFPGDHYLEVKTAGVYKIDWSLICQIDGLTGGSEHVEFEVLKNGNATGKGESHVTHKNTARDFPLASTTLLDLAVDDEISIGATARDSSGKTITIDHLEMTIFMVGGT